MSMQEKIVTILSSLIPISGKTNHMEKLVHLKVQVMSQMECTDQCWIVLCSLRETNLSVMFAKHTF